MLGTLLLSLAAGTTPCVEDDAAAVNALKAYGVTISACSDISATGSCSLLAPISGLGLCPCSCPPASGTGSTAGQNDTAQVRIVAGVSTVL